MMRVADGFATALSLSGVVGIVSESVSACSSTWLAMLLSSNICAERCEVIYVRVVWWILLQALDKIIEILEF